MMMWLSVIHSTYV